MGILSKIKGWFSMILHSKAKQEFNIEPIGTEQMQAWINECVNIYQGNPCWINEEDHIDTVNFAKAICSETARLVTLGIGIHVDGSARAEWLQKQVERIYYQLRNWVEYGCAYGTVIMKPDGNVMRLYTPGEFEVTHHTDGKIDGVIFHNWEKVGEKWYTLLEHHHSEEGLYVITNKCYVGASRDNTEKRVDIKTTPWAQLQDEVRIANMTGNLYGVLRMPHANNIDLDSPYGLPVFSEAIQELRDLDIAYSRNAKEVIDSKRTVLLDTDRLLPNSTRAMRQNALGHSPMPDYIKLVEGDTSLETDIYHEINPNLNTDTRLKGINALLSQIGYKVGFSNGYFVFNESSGIQTATGVEAEQQRTIQFIKDVRDKLEDCLKGLIYALNVFADLYGLAPKGTYELFFDFGDITYNREDDRARWWGYVASGKVPAWMFFVKFEGMTEEDAKAMVAEAAPKTPTLFGPEE
jgi:A118 family predicted phage portal protein